MASLLTLPDELLCRIADHCIARPRDLNYAFPSSKRACGPARLLVGLTETSKRLHRVLRGKLYHTFDFSLHSFEAQGLARQFFTLDSFCRQLESGSIKHAVLRWDRGQDPDEPQPSVYDIIDKLETAACFSQLSLITLVDFDFDYASTRAMPLVIPHKVQQVNILWSEYWTHQRRGLGGFLRSLQPHVFVDICALDDAYDEAGDEAADYADHLSDTSIQSLGIYGLRGMPFGVGWLAKLTHLGIDTSQVSDLATALQSADARLVELRVLEVHFAAYGIRFPPAVPIEIAGLLRRTPGLRECTIPMDCRYDYVRSVHDALSVELELLRFSITRLGTHILRFIEPFYNARHLPKLRQFYAEINWDLIIHTIRQHDVSCAQQRQVCEFVAVENVRSKIKQVNNVQDELHLLCKLAAAETAYDMRLQSFACRIRRTLEHALDEREIHHRVTPVEYEFPGNSRSHSKQMTLSVSYSLTFYS